MQNDYFSVSPLSFLLLNFEGEKRRNPDNPMPLTKHVTQTMIRTLSL